MIKGTCNKQQVVTDHNHFSYTLGRFMKKIYIFLISHSTNKNLFDLE